MAQHRKPVNGKTQPEPPPPDALVGLVEEVGLVFEEFGLPRMAGRVLGWLLVSRPPEQSAADLASVLGASAGSISGMTRYLIQLGLIERVALPGARRDHFRIRRNAWPQLLRVRLAVVSRIHDAAERGLLLLAGTPVAYRERLREVRDFYHFIDDALPGLLVDWERQEHRRSAPAGTTRRTDVRPHSEESAVGRSDEQHGDQ